MPEASVPLSPKRAEIADAALRIIGGRGIAALTTATLAAELGVSSGAPFRHFASLENILEAAAQRTEEILRATLPDPTLPPLLQLERLFMTRAETVGQHAGVARLMFSEQFTLALPPAAAARLVDLVSDTRASILEMLCAAAAKGQIRRDLSPKDLLPVVMGSLQHLVFLSAMKTRDSMPPSPGKVYRTLARLLAPASPARN